MTFKVVELLLEGGMSPYGRWFAELDPVVAAKIATAKYRMQQGNLSNVEWFRGIGEYKINYGAGWRIYFGIDGLEIIVLLGGGSKARQQRDIDHAVELWDGYKKKKALIKNSKKKVSFAKK